MCLAIPGKVVKITGRKAWVRYPNTTRRAMIAEKNVRVGDTVLVQMGLVISILNAKAK